MTKDSYVYYFNTTAAADGSSNSVPAKGTLFWRLPVQINETTPFVEQPMTLQYSPGTNVATPLLGFDYGTQVGFDGDSPQQQRLFVQTWFDDSTFEPGVQPTIGSGYALYRWFVCWQYIGGYYYQSVGFATTLPPNNPTCQAVEILQQFPGY